MVTEATESRSEPLHRDPGDLTEARIWRVLRSVMDPEIPALSVVDLGVVRYVRSERGAVRVGITP
ncbi:MAG: iron-sulfur cluster assembly protein, partial [Steroidobacteraceae bacterium]